MRWFFPMAVAALMAAAPGCSKAQPNTTLIPALERLAQANNAEAIYHLGMAYQTGTGVPEDHARALDAFRKAAALSDPLASYKLGCYFGGQGAGLVAEDPELALKYKLVAAEAGYALAQQDVAVIYVRRGDTSTGLNWLEKAVAQGWSGGLMTYSSIFNGAPGIARDPAKTAAYFRLFLDRTEASDRQREWLQNFEKQLSPQERERAAEIVRRYQPAPTAITLKALSGQRAAQVLVARVR